MIALPLLVAASPRSWLPMSDAAAVSLGEWFLADSQARSIETLVETLQGDPPLALWVALKADRLASAPPQSLADLAALLAEHGLSWLQWDAEPAAVRRCDARTTARNCCPGGGGGRCIGSGGRTGSRAWRNGKSAGPPPRAASRSGPVAGRAGTKRLPGNRGFGCRNGLRRAFRSGRRRGRGASRPRASASRLRQQGATGRLRFWDALRCCRKSARFARLFPARPGRRIPLGGHPPGRPMADRLDGEAGKAIGLGTIASRGGRGREDRGDGRVCRRGGPRDQQSSGRDCRTGTTPLARRNRPRTPPRPGPDERPGHAGARDDRRSAIVRQSARIGAASRSIWSCWSAA